MAVVDSVKVELPSLPGSCFFVSCLFLDAMSSLFFCKSQVVQEIMECGRGTILKVWGTWSWKEDRMKVRMSLSERSCRLLNVSASLLNSPRKCWLYMQHLCSISRDANFRDVI